MNKKIAIDIGNTRIKVLTSQGDHISFSYRDLNKCEIEEILSTILDDCKIGISSVNEEIIDFVKEMKFKNLIFTDDILKNQKFVSFNKIKGIGSDRIFGLIAASNLSEDSLITIDCGTAITINFMNKNREILGGYILPGLRTQLDSINSKTNQIFIEPEKLKNYKPQTEIPNNTVDSVLGGIIDNTANGIIMTIINNFSQLNPKNIYITGGYREFIINSFHNNKFYDLENNQFVFNKKTIKLINRPNLVLEGILDCL